jgi:hypothetical protein
MMGGGSSIIFLSNSPISNSHQKNMILVFEVFVLKQVIFGVFVFGKVIFEGLFTTLSFG